MLLRTFIVLFLCEHMFLILLYIYLRVKILAHIVTPCLTIWRIARLIKMAASFYIPINRIWEFQFLYIQSNTIFLFLILNIIVELVDVKWYFIMVLICIFPVNNDVEYFFMCSLTSYISFLDKCLFKSYAHLLNEFFMFSSSFKNFFLCTLDTTFLSDICF